MKLLVSAGIALGAVGLAVGGYGMAGLGGVMLALIFLGTLLMAVVDKEPQAPSTKRGPRQTYDGFPLARRQRDQHIQ